MNVQSANNHKYKTIFKNSFMLKKFYINNKSIEINKSKTARNETIVVYNNATTTSLFSQ